MPFLSPSLFIVLKYKYNVVVISCLVSNPLKYSTHILSIVERVSHSQNSKKTQQEIELHDHKTINIQKIFSYEFLFRFQFSH
jgi:hypothetical protein